MLFAGAVGAVWLSFGFPLAFLWFSFGFPLTLLCLSLGLPLTFRQLLVRVTLEMIFVNEHEVLEGLVGIILGTC